MSNRVKRILQTRWQKTFANQKINLIELILKESHFTIKKKIKIRKEYWTTAHTAPAT